MPLCNRMFCCIFGWYFYIEIRLKYEKKILLSSSRAFSLSTPTFSLSTPHRRLRSNYLSSDPWKNYPSASEGIFGFSWIMLSNDAKIRACFPSFLAATAPKVSFFGMCSKMQIIPIKNLNIKKVVPQFLWFFRLKCRFKGQIISTGWPICIWTVLECPWGN